MKRLILLITIIIALVGCSSEGDLSIKNNTSHPTYITLDGKDYTLQAQESISFSYDLGTKIPFKSDPDERKLIYLKGDTFRLWDHTVDRFTDSTYVTINHDETTRIFMNATDAAAKLINNSDKVITHYVIEGGKTNEIVQNVHEMHNIEPGESVLFYLPYKSGNVTYHYRAYAYCDDGTFYESSPAEQYRVLTLDDVIIIEVNN
jgi:uncharacterized protein YcfL